MLLLAGLANFLFIGLKAFQQRNIVYNDYAFVVVTSYLIAVAEVYVVFTIASNGFVWQLVLTLGSSGALGALVAMKLHNYLKPHKG